MGLPLLKNNTPTVNSCIVEHMYIVDQEVYKLMRRGVMQYDFDELKQLGMIGLIEAAHRFDQQYQCSFSVYARIRVQGAIIDDLRKKDWVPRSVRKRAQRFNEAVSYLSDKLSRLPTQEEICLHLDIPEEKFDVFRRLCAINPLISMEEGGETPIHSTLPNDEKDAQETILHKEDIRILRTCIRDLTQQEKDIVQMYYFADNTLRTIAEHFQVSESRICQLHSKIKKKLHRAFTRHTS